MQGKICNGNYSSAGKKRVNRSARSTTGAIFVFRALCDRYKRKRDGELHACFVDLTQAFDRVSWDLLWQALRVSGAPDKLIQIIKTVYAQSKIWIRTEPTESPQAAFEPTAGVRQGCVLLSTLFILMFDFIIRAAMHGCNQLAERVNWLGGVLLALLGYADDVVLIARISSSSKTPAPEAGCTSAQRLDSST